MCNKENVLQECQDLINNGADMLDILKYVSEETDLDPVEIINKLFY